jgi:hypothetical protein
VSVLQFFFISPKCIGVRRANPEKLESVDSRSRFGGPLLLKEV